MRRLSPSFLLFAGIGLALLAHVGLAAREVPGIDGQTLRVIPESETLLWCTWISLFTVSGFLLLGTLAIRTRSDAMPLPAAETGPFRPRETLVGGLVLLAGTIVTTARLAHIPSGLNHDAAWEGLYALSILEGAPYTPYTPAAWGRETLTFYIRAVSIWCLGPTVLAIVLPGVIAGSLTLPLFYSWLRLMFGPMIAPVGTALLGFSGWHFLFSRTGWRSDFQPFFMLLAFSLCARGLAYGRRHELALAGFALALVVHTYNAGRTVPLFMAFWIALSAIDTNAPLVWLRQHGTGVLLFGVCFLLGTAPLITYGLDNWDLLFGRYEFLRSQHSFPQALSQLLLLFHHSGNGNDFFVTTPGLELPAAFCLTIGFIAGMRRWKDRRVQLLFGGLLITALPGLLTRPNMNRCVGMMPFIYALAALGAWQLMELTRRVAGTAAARVLLAFILISSAATTWFQYLGPDRRDVWGFFPEATVLGKRIDQLASDYVVVVGDTPWWPRDTLTYLSYRGSGDPFERRYVWVDDITNMPRMRLQREPGKGVVFIVERNERGRRVLESLQRTRGPGTLEKIRDAREGRAFALELRYDDLSRPQKPNRSDGSSNYPGDVEGGRSESTPSLIAPRALRGAKGWTPTHARN